MIVEIDVQLHHSLDDSGETPFVEHTLAVTYDTDTQCIKGDAVLYTRDRVGYTVSNAVAVLLLEGLPASSEKCWLPKHVVEACNRAAIEKIAVENGRKRVA